jgi:hypothetical protein
MDKHFGISTYSLTSLLGDEQLRILERILESTLGEVESVYRQVYQSHLPLMRFIAEVGSSMPGALKSAAEFVLNRDLSRRFAANKTDEDAIRKLLAEASMWSVQLDAAGLGHVFRQTLEKRAAELVSNPDSVALVTQLVRMVELARSLPFAVELRGTQNLYHRLLITVFAEFQRREKNGDPTARGWVGQFVKLGITLSMSVAHSDSGFENSIPPRGAEM